MRPWCHKINDVTPVKSITQKSTKLSCSPQLGHSSHHLHLQDFPKQPNVPYIHYCFLFLHIRFIGKISVPRGTSDFPPRSSIMWGPSFPGCCLHCWFRSRLSAINQSSHSGSFVALFHFGFRLANSSWDIVAYAVYLSATQASMKRLGLWPADTLLVRAIRLSENSFFCLVSICKLGSIWCSSTDSSSVMSSNCFKARSDAIDGTNDDVLI